MTASPRNSRKVGSTASGGGASATIDSVMPVSRVIWRGIEWPGFTKVRKRAEPLAAAELDRADLGDAAVGRGAAGGLEVQHAERDLVERGAQVVEARACMGGP